MPRPTRLDPVPLLPTRRSCHQPEPCVSICRRVVVCGVLRREAVVRATFVCGTGQRREKGGQHAARSKRVLQLEDADDVRKTYDATGHACSGWSITQPTVACTPCPGQRVAPRCAAGLWERGVGSGSRMGHGRDCRLGWQFCNLHAGCTLALSPQKEMVLGPTSGVTTHTNTWPMMVSSMSRNGHARHTHQ
jgi:hypothetical protein